MTTVLIVAAVFVALGTTILLNLALTGLVEAGGAVRIRLGRASRALARAGVLQQRKPLAAERASDLLRPAPFPMMAYAGAGALSAAGMLLSHNMLSLIPVVLVLVARPYTDARFRTRLAHQTYDFLLRLRMQLSLKGALLAALQALAEEGETIPSKVVGIYLGTGEMDGLRVLQRAAQAGVPYLSDVSARAAITRGASLSVDQAVANAIDDLREELDAKTAERVEAVPSRMIIIVFPLLLGPALVVLLYPVVNSVLSTLSFTTVPFP